LKLGGVAVCCRKQGISTEAAADKYLGAVRFVYRLALQRGIAIREKERKKATGAAAGDQIDRVKKRRMLLHDAV
jgi:protoporphyrinogen oxidase